MVPRIGRECSMGYHDSCSDHPHSGRCECPHHPLVTAVYDWIGTALPADLGDRLQSVRRPGEDLADTAARVLAAGLDALTGPTPDMR